MKRKIVQVAAFGYSNTYIGNFVSGQIYKGSWKQFCNPGMNCYSCPAARLACPIGAMQAVSGSMNFKLSFYVIGFVLALGVVFVIIMPVTMVNELGMSSPAFCEYICPAGTLEGGIPLLSTHPELRATLGALFSVKACILIIIYVRWM